MILNRQTKIKIDLQEAAALAEKLGKVLGLAGSRFNVCFVDDDQIRALNAAYRGRSEATDVLSFPWNPASGPASGAETSGVLSDPDGEFQGFLGEIAISAETAERNAETEGHAPTTEISWLILHGLLHLIGMDHETDSGEMVALEHGLRERLGLEGSGDLSSRRIKKSTPKPGSRRSPIKTQSGERSRVKGGLQTPRDPA